MLNSAKTISAVLRKCAIYEIIEGGGGVPRGPFPGSATDCSLSRFCVSLLVVGQHEKWNISANNGKRKMARGSNNAQNSLQLYRLS